MFTDTAKTAISVLRDITILEVFMQGARDENILSPLREMAQNIQKFGCLPDAEMENYDAVIQEECEKKHSKEIRPADFSVIFAAICEMSHLTDDIDNIRGWLDTLDCIIDMIPDMNDCG